jgi:hypothetical protein
MQDNFEVGLEAAKCGNYAIVAPLAKARNKDVNILEAALSGIEASPVGGTGEDALLANTRDLLAAIRLCLTNHLRMPALTLIYCGIDFMAALGQQSANKSKSKERFVLWADSNMDCQQRLGVSSIDLYAARCGIVHSYTIDSDLSEKGQACRILYAWGNADIEEPARFLQSLGCPEKIIKIEALFEAFAHGVEMFGERLEHDPNFSSLVLKRSRKLFCDQSFFPTDKNRHLWE